MSVVAAKVYTDHIEVAADSIIVQGDMKRSGFFSKLECINDMIIGACERDFFNVAICKDPQARICH